MKTLTHNGRDIGEGATSQEGRDASPRRPVIIGVLLAFLFALPVRAQIQQAWIAHYNNGISTGTNTALKMTLDSVGNIIVTGVSQNTNGNLGYATIKYAPNGNQLWATRYDSTNYPKAAPTAMSIDTSNNVFVTGSALTVKYDPNGNKLWTAPYAGLAVGCDLAGNTFVTGYGTNFNTVKLNSAGSNLWFASCKDYGPTVGQAIAVDSSGNVCVSGSDIIGYYMEGPVSDPTAVVLTIEYAANGSQLWLAQYENEEPFSVQVVGAAVDNTDDILIGCTVNNPTILKYGTNGQLIWTSSPTYAIDTASAFSLDRHGNTYLTVPTLYDYEFNIDYYCIATYGVSSNGSNGWTDRYPSPPVGISMPNCISTDQASNCYVAGYSTDSNGSNNMVTIASGPNGNQIWLQRYVAPGDCNSAGNAIAVDKNGNVYVAGYDTTAAGGTEMVLIKYSPLLLQMQTNGTVLLQAQGSPGENFNIESSTNLINWFTLGTATADTNGLMQFTDTNAPNYPARFYNTTPQ